MVMATEEGVLKILEKCGCLLTGQFILKSGVHADRYVQKDLVIPIIKYSRLLFEWTAGLMRPHNIEVVVGPAEGAVGLSMGVAIALQEILNDHVTNIPVLRRHKRDDQGNLTEVKEFYIRPDHIPLFEGKRVAIAEDILTTGSSAKEVREVVESYGGIVVGVSAICNRGGVIAEDMGVEHVWALSAPNVESWADGEEPDWLKEVPINTQIGHGAAYLKARGGQYP